MEEQSLGPVRVSAEALPESSVSTREARPEAQGLPLADDGIARAADLLLAFPHL